MSEIKLPKTVEQAVSRLMTELSIHDKRKIVNTPKGSLPTLHFAVGTDIRNDFGLWSGNEKLFESCWLIADQQDLDIDDASFIILNALWERLQKYPPPRIVKKGTSSSSNRSRVNKKERGKFYEDGFKKMD